MKLFSLYFLILFLLAGNPAMGAKVTIPVLDPGLVTWRSLTFTSKSFLGTARSVVEFNTHCCNQPTPPEQCNNFHNQRQRKPTVPAVESCLSVTTAIKPYFSTNRFYQTKVWFSPAEGTAFRRLRLMQGKKYYLKDYLFTPVGVYRYRKTPINRKEKKLKPPFWSAAQETFYPFPDQLIPATLISEPSLILYYLAARAPQPEAEPAEVTVFHKKRYHIVKFTRIAPIRIQVDYFEQQNAQNKQEKKGEMQLAGYRITSQPVEGNNEATEKFSLMGLTGDIIIYFNEESRTPIRIDGDMPLIGRVHFNLRRVMRANRR